MTAHTTLGHLNCSNHDDKPAGYCDSRAGTPAGSRAGPALGYKLRLYR